MTLARRRSSPLASVLRMAASIVALVLTASPVAAQLSAESLEECMKPTPPARFQLAREMGVWRPGQPIPAEALRFASSCGCLLLPTDSAVVMREATNYPFLIALAAHPKADPVVVGMAVDRALLLRGPTIVFADLAERYRSDPRLLELAAHKAIQARMQQRNVWVRGMDVEPAAFRRAGFGEQQAGIALMEVARRLRQGENWSSLYDEYSRRYRGKDGYTLVGDFSSYVTSEKRDEKNGGLELLVPSYHLPRLLRSKAGEVVILPVKSGAYGFSIGFGPFILLWQVLEVYAPGPAQSEIKSEPVAVH